MRDRSFNTLVYGGLALSVVAVAALTACAADEACAAGPSNPRPPAPAYRAPAPAYKPPAAPKAPVTGPKVQSVPKAPVSKPTVYKTTYDSHGYPIIIPVVVDDDAFESDDCD
ncbi:hypothetical protein [Micromonospora sp. NPDC048839]|uniref:hypothetical protein n=1 Tax=Micromonospora sp. NPDC048839 TaxID=3155641 RepID=UPI00340EEC15